MTPVKSDSIAAVKHDPLSRTLTVQFNNGGVYSVDGVSADHHAAFMRSDSKGEHFNSVIRPNFNVRKVT